jgi:Spy/CpxP family protein refolding chaperone
MRIRKSWTRSIAFGLFGAAALAWAGILAAQESSAPPHPPQPETAATRNPAHGSVVEMRLGRLSQQLNLTDEQKAKIRPVLRRETERILLVRGNTSLSQGEAQRRIKLIRGDIHQRISEFLTPEQKNSGSKAARRNAAAVCKPEQ